MKEEDELIETVCEFCKETLATCERVWGGELHFYIIEKIFLTEEQHNLLKEGATH